MPRYSHFSVAAAQPKAMLKKVRMLFVIVTPTPVT
jgi:hypothetical protein